MQTLKAHHLLIAPPAAEEEDQGCQVRLKTICLAAVSPVRVQPVTALYQRHGSATFDR